MYKHIHVVKLTSPYQEIVRDTYGEFEDIYKNRVQLINKTFGEAAKYAGYSGEIYMRPYLATDLSAAELLTRFPEQIEVVESDIAGMII